MEKTKRTIDELNLIDDFLFTELMLDKESAENLARMIIERATNLNVGNLIIEYQKVVNGLDTTFHGIRMDMSVTEERETEDTESPDYWDEITIRKDKKTKKEIVRLYDIEPNNGKKEELPKRSRYSQALMDVKLLESGTDYIDMPELWTFWILPYDPFGCGQMIYSVKNVVEDFEDIPYNDGIRKIFLYTGGTFGGNEKLKSLLNYMADSTEENATDSELQKLHSSVKKIKRNKEIGVKYMRAYQSMIDLQMEVKRAQAEAQEAQQQMQAVQQQMQAAQQQMKEAQQQLKKSYHEGIADGEKRGLELGEERNAQLTAMLLKEEKYEELKRSAEDEAYRKKLYQKYGI